MSRFIKKMSRFVIPVVLVIIIIGIKMTSNAFRVNIPNQDTKTAPTPLILPNSAIVEARTPTEIPARITCYKETGNLTASGKIPKNGMVATSDRTIPFGTEVYIDEEKFIVEDKTALWVHEKKGFTIDIFMEEGCDLNFGANLKNIYIK